MKRLEWEHVWSRYERTWIIRDVTLGAAEGEIIALMGTAGCGKSTLLRTACSDPRAESGRVWVDGRDAVRRRDALLAPSEALPGSATVERCLARRIHGAGVKGRAADRRAKAAMRAWDLDRYRGIRVRALPDSVQARVALATQWACPATAWLLDGPSAALEPVWRTALPGLLRVWAGREGGAIVIATHDSETAATADRVAILSGGRLAALDAPSALCAACAEEEVVVRTVDRERAADAIAGNLHLEAERLTDGLRLRVRHAESALPGILRTLGAEIETVWVRRPSLLDAVAYFSALPPAPNAPNRPPVRRA